MNTPLSAKAERVRFKCVINSHPVPGSISVMSSAPDAVTLEIQ